MTFIEKFNQIKKKYGKIDESKLTENFAVQVEMTDEDCGGIFYIANMDAPFAVEPYDYYDNTAAIRISSKVLENVLSCKADAKEEFFAGNIQVDGDIGHALMVVDLMKKEPKPRKPRKAKTEEKAVAKVKEEKSAVEVKETKAEKVAVKEEKKEKAVKKPAIKKSAKKTAK